jgi:hypothetical protein
MCVAALFVVEVGWQAAGVAWIVQQYEHCSGEPHIFICLGMCSPLPVLPYLIISTLGLLSYYCTVVLNIVII